MLRGTIIPTDGEEAQTIAAPSDPQATASDGSVDLDAGTVGNADSYRWYRSTTSGSGFTNLVQDLASPSYTDTTVVNNNTYYYKPTAFSNSLGSSGFGTEVSATPTGSVSARFPGDPKVLGNGYTYWGQSQKGNSEPTDHESAAGTLVGCRRRFDSGFNPSTLVSWAAADHAASRGGVTGRLPILSTKPNWAQAASGALDSQFDSLISGLEALDMPTVVILFHEPEDNTTDYGGSTGSIADWKGMQTRFRQRMDAYGTINRIIFAPVLINFTWQHASRDPDDFWVDGIWDVFGIDSYIYADMSYPRQQWLDAKAWCQNKGIPYGVCEWGLRRESEDPDNYVSMQDWWDDSSDDRDHIWFSYFDSDANSTGSGWELYDGDQMTTTYRNILQDARAVHLTDLGY